MTREIIEQKKLNLCVLGDKLLAKNNESNEVYLYAKAKNPWFTMDFIIQSVNNIVVYYFQKTALDTWLSSYDLSKNSSKQVGIIVAGNIPLVGLHDIICAYFTSHQILIKLSSKDDVLMNYFMQEWAQIDADLMSQFRLSDMLKNQEAIIATGSDTTHKYFEHYFKDIPRILRKNRNSIAVLSGTETEQELQGLSDDIFMYFGLGCRNVSLILVPRSFEIRNLFPYFDKYEYMKNHVKYMNNYDYNRTLLLMNQIPHLSSDYVILEEKLILSSRLATLHYSYYDDLQEAQDYIAQNNEQIQCVVSSIEALKPLCIAFGQSQKPSLSQYADNIDTLEFLINL